MSIDLFHSELKLTFALCRCVLAACSPVLAWILSSSSVLVDLQALFLPASVLVLVIDYIYTGTLSYSQTREHYYSLLAAAHYLQMTELQEALRTWQEANDVNVNSQSETDFSPESVKRTERFSDGEGGGPSGTVDSWVGGREHNEPGVVHQTSTRDTELLMDLPHPSGAVTPPWRQRSTDEELKNRSHSLTPPSSPPHYRGAVTVIRHSGGPQHAQPGLEQNVQDSSRDEPCFSSSTKGHCAGDGTDLDQQLSGCDDDMVHNPAAPESSGLVNATHTAVYQRFDVKRADTETRQHPDHRGVDRSYFGYVHYHCLSKEDTHFKPSCMVDSSPSSDEEQTGTFTGSGSTAHWPALAVVPSREVLMLDIGTSQSAELFTSHQHRRKDVGETEIPLEENCSGTDERKEPFKDGAVTFAKVKQTSERVPVAAGSNQGQTTVGITCGGGSSGDVSHPDPQRVLAEVPDSGPVPDVGSKNPPSAALHLFQCSLCERSFSQRGSLNRHLRRHLGLRPFSCPCCPMTFSRQYRVTEHMRVHQRCGQGNHLLKPPTSSV